MTLQNPDLKNQNLKIAMFVNFKSKNGYDPKFYKKPLKYLI
jgi:hypothetical protein